MEALETGVIGDAFDASHLSGNRVVGGRHLCRVHLQILCDNIAAGQPRHQLLVPDSSRGENSREKNEIPISPRRSLPRRAPHLPQGVERRCTRRASSFSPSVDAVVFVECVERTGLDNRPRPSNVISGFDDHWSPLTATIARTSTTRWVTRAATAVIKPPPPGTAQPHAQKSPAPSTWRRAAALAALRLVRPAALPLHPSRSIARGAGCHRLPATESEFACPRIARARRCISLPLSAHVAGWAHSP